VSGSRVPALLACAGLLAALAAVAGGCGIGPGRGPQGVTLVVTRDFGDHSMGGASVRTAPGSETVMRFLQRHFDVKTRYGGGFVQSISGITGGREHGRPADWFFYVNGLESSKGAAERRLHRGDRVWWDHHEWGATMRIPAVVGSFPEPFRSGIDGKRYPTTVSCGDGREAAACSEVEHRLRDAGVPVGRDTGGVVSGAKQLRVVVGRWPALRQDHTTALLEGGPQSSGVYARIDRTGGRIDLLDARGTVVKRLGPGSGLVAATRENDEAPLWIVTGTDAAGVRAAARAFNTLALANHFALAVPASGAPLGLPVVAP
jgi:hypothetical protein